VLGKRVRVNYKGQGKWWECTVTGYEGGRGEYTVVYDNKVKETNVRKQNIVFL